MNENFTHLRAEILKTRNCGLIHCEFIERDKDDDIRSSLIKFSENQGFKIVEFDGGRLEKINIELAQKILTYILHYDLAYHSEIMPIENASLLARRFLKLFSPDIKFFSNSPGTEEVKNEIVSMTGWLPITQATFDTGVIAVDGNHIGCLWVEDED